MDDVTLQDPLAHFLEWMEEAKLSEPSDANAMTLATADGAGRPSARMVLLKQADAQGFVFYTNLESRKAGEIAENPQAALLFHWKSLRRQVRIEGAVEPVPDAEADGYFATRDRGSQIGAWASRQSRAMTDRFELERRVAQFTAKFGLGRIPRPEFWSGFRLRPIRYEFWSDRRFRLHDRLVFERHGDGWRTERLFP